jgi:hypothetical protein
MKGLLLFNVLSCPLETQNNFGSSSNISHLIEKNASNTSENVSSLLLQENENQQQKTKSKNPSIKLVENVKITDEANELLKAVEEGLQLHEPELADEGEGGTYFLKDKSGQRVAVFKPFDEQPQAENNPKRKTSQALCLPEAFSGIKLEETHRNEVAAYLLDREGFAGVPLTVLVECTHTFFASTQRARSPKRSPPSGGNNRRRSVTSPSPPSPTSAVTAPSEVFLTTKIGSLQKYMDYEAQSWDMGSTLYPVREVHRIGLLDIRILNLDRHGGNMLVIHGEGERRSVPDHWSSFDDDDYEEKNYHLVPIDHAFSLPDVTRLNCSDLWFEWYNWSQTSQPFSEETLTYIEKINLESDVDLLLNLKVRRECIETMILTTSLLKFTALSMKMNLKEIARLIIRENPNKPSALEKINSRVQRERLFSKGLSYASEPKALTSRSSSQIPALGTFFPPKFSKSRSTSKLPPCNSNSTSSASQRSARSPRRRQNGNSRSPSISRHDADHDAKKVSFDVDNWPKSGPCDDREDLKKFAKLVHQIIELTLPAIVSGLPKADERVKKTQSISNQAYLQQLVEEQLKL